ncbi:hypothetical protein AAG607_12245 [Citromicrobium bathyomarinum]|uniref:hypothetical protein n=1 Tax=Citromicrobium bathyomarinum TaxID=72174 RepID=UPI003159FA37
MSGGDAQLDAFAQLLEQDLPLGVIGQRLGYARPVDQARAQLQRLRRQLGWQAQ